MSGLPNSGAFVGRLLPNMDGMTDIEGAWTSELLTKPVALSNSGALANELLPNIDDLAYSGALANVLLPNMSGLAYSGSLADEEGYDKSPYVEETLG